MGCRDSSVLRMNLQPVNLGRLLLVSLLYLTRSCFLLRPRLVMHTVSLISMQPIARYIVLSLR